MNYLSGGLLKCEYVYFNKMNIYAVAHEFIEHKIEIKITAIHKQIPHT